MVRIEKNLYEKIFNNRFIGRERNITKPSRIELLEEIYLRLSPYGNFFSKLIPQRLSIAFSSFQYKYYRWNIISRGFSWGDTAVHTDEMLRRSAIFEHINRENFNPYYYSMIAFRRRRYYKVDNAIEGFYAQEEIQKEASDQYLLKVRPEILKFRQLFHEYQNEMIPRTHYTNGSIGSIFDLIFFKNAFLRIGWNRLFFNEEHYVDIKEFREDLYAPSNKNKMTEKEFEDFLTFFNKHRPGIIAPDGQDVNFEEFSGLLKENPEMVTKEGYFDLMGFVDLFFRQRESSKIELKPRKEMVENKNMVGIEIPEILRTDVGTSFM